MDDLAAQADALPTAAGVYLFEDARGRVLYVGKAINLRARVRQYIAGQDERFMVPFLIRQARRIEVIATDTEKEALILENSLIKKHQPRYNTKLVDDKNFLHLRIDPKAPWPRFQLVRRIQGDGAKYFGPYTSASRARQTLAALSRGFPLRSCSDVVLNSRKRPCLLHQMKRCAAPCVGLIDREAYGEIVDEAALFLSGKHRPLVTRLKGRMLAASDAERFEEAARLRDLVKSIDATIERQKIVDPKLRDRDVWGLYREGSRGTVALVPVRDGMMGEPVISPVGDLPGDDEDVLSTLILDAYTGRDVPPEILVPVRPRDADAVEEILAEERGSKVSVRVPERGDAVGLVALATENARLRFVRDHDADALRIDALIELGKLLGLSGPPHRIECFDNSNLQGTAAVAAMSVLIDGKPARAEYRRYKIKTVVGADDFASMREILGRRVTRAIRENTVPDLIVIDGGVGQVNAALAALADVGATIPLVGLQKPRTERKHGDRFATDAIVLPNVKDPLRLRSGDARLRLLQHVRDEVHDHAVRYHRKVRGKEALTSVLEAIPGIGPTRKKALITALGSAQGVYDADEETLAAVPGIGAAVAKGIFAALHGDEAATDYDV